MSNKYLILSFQGNQKKFPLNKERIVVGRDKSCDIVVDEEGVSRKHAAIIFRFDAIYVENISLTGELKKLGEKIEYAELHEGETCEVGTAQLSWHEASSHSEVGPESVVDGDARTSMLPSARAPVHHEPEAVADPRNEVAGHDPNFAMDFAPSEADPAQVGGFDLVSADAKTQVVNAHLVPVLKIVKGEESGREIKMTDGVVWIVGRSAKCHVQVDHQKFSRQHFKILKVGESFRIQDMGSANGTRLNGVSVSDAPLVPFDTIQVGPTEIQFLMVESGLARVNLGQSHGGPDGFHESPQGEPEKTRILAAGVPAVFQGRPAGADFGFSEKARGGNTESAILASESIGESPNEEVKDGAHAPVPPKKPIDLLKFRARQGTEWYKKQPKPRKIMIAVGAAVLIFGLCSTLLSSESPPLAPVVATTPAATDPKAGAPASTSNEANAADMRDISPEFNLLPTDEQNRIRSLYVQADQARNDKNWQKAHDLCREIFQKLKKYKSTGEIMDEAASHLNESLIGQSKTLNNVQDAEKENSENVDRFIANGEKALHEKKWSDAQDSFSKALSIDPKNKKAERGFQAAQAQDESLVMDNPMAPPPKKDDPAEAATKAAQEVLESLKIQLEAARSSFNDSKFAACQDNLKDLESKVTDFMFTYEEPKDAAAIAQAEKEKKEGGRLPASVREGLLSEAASISTSIRELREQTQAQLKASYQAQLADAARYTDDKVYTEALRIYNSILSSDRDFEEAILARQRLYTKMVGQARMTYQEALIYESVGDLENATAGFQKTKELLASVDDYEGREYYKKAERKLTRLQR